MRRARDRARRAAQTAEERDARLRQIRDNRRQILATESEEKRAARLQQMSANQHHRMAAETGSEREARLQGNREGQRGQQSQLPLFEQPSVQAKMRKFHAEIAALEMQKCTTCSERFPGLQLRSHSTEALLPEDDDLSGLYSMTVDSPSDDSELSSTQDVDLYDANLSRTFLPLTPSRMTEQEAIRHSVQERQSNLPSTVAWPPTGETPINEFRTEGYISCAFPTLFPTGAADFVAPRACAVTIGNYFKHLLMYEDGRLHLHTVHLLYFVWYLIITYSTSFRPRQPRRTNHAARACASIAFELTLAPTMLCIHLVIIMVVYLSYVFRMCLDCNLTQPRAACGL